MPQDSRPAAFSSYKSYILRDAVWTGTAPVNSTYDLNAFAAMHPGYRIKFGSSTIIITATIPTPRKAEVAAIAGSNIDAGSSVLRITNNAGLDVAVDVPELPSDDIPLTAVLDLRDYANDADRTADVWNWIASGNSTNVTMMALLWLGLLEDFTYEPGLVVKEVHFSDVHENKAGSINVVRWRQRKRWIEFTSPANESQREALISWIRAGEGFGIPSLVWPRTDVNDCLLGAFEGEYGSTENAWDYNPMKGKFVERPKGIPLL